MDLQTRIPISNGTSIPCVGFGTWKTPDEEAAKSVAEALRVGYRHIDTATAYGNEAGVGEQAALSIVEERKNGPFLSQEEVIIRCSRVSKSVVEMLAGIGALDDMPESTQVSLF